MYTGDYEDESEPETDEESEPANLATEDNGSELNDWNKPPSKYWYPRARCGQSVGYANLDLYVTADKFMIETLKEAARKRFITWFESYDGSELASLTRKAFDILPPHDFDLREAIIQTVTHCWQTLLFLKTTCFAACLTAV